MYAQCHMYARTGGAADVTDEKKKVDSKLLAEKKLQASGELY